MYLFLLAFGAALSLAGVILAASGLSISDHTIDASLVTPGIVAVVGGLLLVGLGVALRVLQRIEHALETRAVAPRAVHAGTTPEPAAAGASDSPAEISRMPFPVRIARPAQTAADFASPAEKRVEDLPLKFPKVARAGPAPVPEETEASTKQPLPAAINDTDEAPAESAGSLFARTLRARNGAAPAARISPRVDPSARAPLATQRPIGPAFEALWPKGPRRAAAQVQPAPEIPAVAQPPLVQEPIGQDPVAQEPVVHEPVLYEPVHESAAPKSAVQGQAIAPAVTPGAEPEQASEPLTVLKSGIVDGMAYTLYSDGSIEAQLPQGLLRFGSISELRAHIEQDTQSA
jgi:hypothetical protein